MYKAMVFDLDGTIADTISTIHYYGNRAMKKFNLSEIDKERYKYLVGKGYENLVKGMLVEKNAYTDELFNEMKEYYHDDYETDSLYLSKVYDGIFELISFLKENNFKIAVLSNKPYGAVNDVINHFFEEGTFDMCVGHGLFGKTLKPDPQNLLAILDKMGIKKEECVYVGDTNVDVKTGLNANVFTVGALWGFRTYDELKEAGAHFIAEKPTDIINLIKEMQK
ncbi:MAG: HAD family hydrolase [Ruminococcaceae bacterium]|nr:HAD family hydrolase [Oscillospiraceae bacterium]